MKTIEHPVLLLNVAALSLGQIGPHTPHLAALAARGAATPLIPPFGALTCPAHIAMTTGRPPSAHGVVANGWYDREHGRWFNWNRSNRLVSGEQIFDTIRARAPDARTASLFWRHTAHSAADLKVIERPTYWASGKKSFDFYTEPGDLHARAKAALGAFPFPFFWGPMAGWKSTQWILDLTQLVLAEDRPALTLSYAPFLDYDGQRFGPDDPRSIAGLTQLDAALGPLVARADALGIDVAIVSDYGFVTVDTPVFPNRALREAGLLAVHRADNGEVLEPAASRAFALCDNQIAHVYVAAPEDRPRVAARLRDLPGVRQVLGPQEIEAAGLAHPRSGDLVLVAQPNAWFAYPYWTDDALAPDFHRCIAIFDKAGFDPCELFGASKLHLARRVLQKKLGMAVPFDVVNPDETQVGGARNVDQADVARGAVLITSWARPDTGPQPTEAVHEVLLGRLFG